MPPGLLGLGKGTLFELRPTLLVSEMWTDNFNLSTTSQPRQQDFRTTVGPGATLLINGATTTGHVTGHAGLTYDTVDSYGFHIFPTVLAGVEQVLGPRVTLTLTDGYIRNDNPSQLTQFGLNVQRQTFSQNSFSAAANYRIEALTLQAYYTNSLFFADASNGSITPGSNTVANILGASANTRLGPLTTAQVGYEHSWIQTSGAGAGSNVGQSSGNLLTASLTRQLGQYSSLGLSTSFQDTALPQSASDSRIWNVSLFGTYGLASHVSLSGSVGYSYLSGSSQPASSGVTTNSNLIYQIAHGVISVGAFSDFRQTGLQGQNFGIVRTTGFTGSIWYDFTPLVSGSVQATYSINEFTGRGNSASTPNQNNLTIGANLSWRLREWLVLRASYSYSYWTNANATVVGASNTGGNTSVNTVTIAASATF